MTIRFSQYLDNLDKKTLYVHRPLLNADKLIEWAKANGCKTCLKPESMHVTLLYSKTPLVWPQPKIDVVTVRDYVSEVKQFDGGALVLHFSWMPFTARHLRLIDAGGTSDYPEYKSHITLTYEGEGLDPKSFGQYDGDLIFGPEVFKEIDLEKKWKNSSLEEAKKYEPLAVEHHFAAAAESGKLMKTPSIHPHVGNDYSGVRAWQGPSGHFYTTQGNTTPGYGFKEEHTDIAHTALDASRDKNAVGNHSGHNYGRAFKGGMIRVRQTPTHLYVETLGLPTPQQVNALVDHAKHTKAVLIDHRNQYTVYDGSVHQHKEGQTGTYLAGIRHALTNPKPDPDAE